MDIFIAKFLIVSLLSLLGPDKPAVTCEDRGGQMLVHHYEWIKAGDVSERRPVYACGYFLD